MPQRNPPEGQARMEKEKTFALDIISQINFQKQSTHKTQKIYLCYQTNTPLPIILPIHLWMNAWMTVERQTYILLQISFVATDKQKGRRQQIGSQ